LAYSQKEKLIMSVAAVETTESVFGLHFRSEPPQHIGGVTMDAYLSFNKRSGEVGRSFGTLAGHINLTQGGLEKPDVGDFIVKGSFADFTITPPEAVSIYFESVPGLLGAQVIHGHILLVNGWERGTTTFFYTAAGGHPLITVANAKISVVFLQP
jgi:hypothetical protein